METQLAHRAMSAARLRTNRYQIWDEFTLFQRELARISLSRQLDGQRVRRRWTSALRTTGRLQK